MAQFNQSFSKANTVVNRTLTLGDFRGVDYFNAKNNVANKRATDMRNLIYKNGANHKRNGWKQFANSHLIVNNEDTQPSINGFWEFKYSSSVTKYIVHAGQKLYEINPTTNVWIDITPALTTINDEVSYGVQRGKRLYIFCGTFVVYGTWNNGTTFVVKKVEDNSDTYIPTVAIGVEPIGSTTSAQSAYEPVNMLSSKVKNRLVGGYTQTHQVYKLADNYDSTTLNGYSFPNTFTGTYNVLYGTDLVTEQSYRLGTPSVVVGYVDTPLQRFNSLILELSFFDDNGSAYGLDEATMKTTFKGSIPSRAFQNGFFSGVSRVDNYLTLFSKGNNSSSSKTKPSDYLSNIEISIKIREINGVYMLYAELNISSNYGYVDMAENNIGVVARISQTSEYNLVASYISSIVSVTNLDTSDLLVANTDYTYSDGVITILTDQTPLIDGQANIEVIINKGSNSASDINKCKFGIMFGYNEVEYLFVSGNPDPNKCNYDWHSAYRAVSKDSDTMTIEEDLTYFPDTGYAVLGSPNQAITGYSYIDDGCLGIHKEYSPVECNFWVRKAYLDQAKNTSGEVVYDIVTNNPLYDVYFSQFSAAIGEGCLNNDCCKTLLGDKLFLSENGLYGIVLDTNSIQSNSRYARERSRFINNRLLQETDLKNAKAIVWDNRYYLAINGRVYIADSRFKTQIDYDDTGDTYTYEWWIWDNCPVNFWFIYDNKLCFGTKDGRLCRFTDDTYVDEKYDFAYSSDISLNNQTYKITYNHTKFGDLTPYDKIQFTSSNMYELVSLSDESDDFDIFYIAYFVGKQFKPSADSSTMYTLYSVDTENSTFVVKNSSNEVVSYVSNAYFPLTEKQNITDIDVENHTFRLLKEDEKQGEYKYLSKGTGDLNAKLYIRTPVKALWFTPVLAFGSNNYLKTINQMTISPETVHNGNLSLNWQTRYKEGNFTIQGVQDLDLGLLNFNSFAIETSSLAKSFTCWKKIRKFNYIQFSFLSNDDHDCAVHSLEIIYYFMERNKGVR